jgi:hypothetical protein
MGVLSGITLGERVLGAIAEVGREAISIVR